jgi:hypothetical protein
MWTMPGGGRLSFGYLERDSDADRYQGSSYTRVYIEELGNFPSPDPIFKLMATLRSAHGVPCGFRSTGNPGGVGQSWIKQRYIDPAPFGMKRLVSTFSNPWTGEKLERDRVFIPSKVLDNPHLPADYIANLYMVGKPKLVKAWLTGDWNQVEGAYFDNFDSDRHIIRPFPLSPRWVRFRAMDWGSAKPFAVGWFVVVGDDQYLRQDDRKVFIPRGALVMYREWYGVQADQEGVPIHNTGLKMDAEDVGAGIVALETEGAPKYSVLDPSAFHRDGGPSISERMADKGAMFERAVNTRTDSLDGRTGGWNMIRHRLNGELGHPMLFFFNTCTHTIRTLPEQQHDKSNPEDIDTEGEDHCFSGDTLVLSDAGPKSIKELVGTTGLIVTDGGRLASYRSVRLTRRNVPVVRVGFSDGSAVTCTPDHLFKTTAGLVRADGLQGKTLLSFRAPSKSLAVSAITYAANTSRQKAGAFISWFGSIIAGLCRTGGMSTIRKLGRTMELTTSSVCLEASTYPSTGKSAFIRSESSISLNGFVPRRPNGIRARPVEHGIGSTTPKFKRTFWPRSHARASNAGESSGELPRVDFAPMPANRLGAERLALTMRGGIAWFAGVSSRRIASVINRIVPGPVGVKLLECVAVEDAGSADVFCLSVPETGLFALANGVVVKNCADMLRYACMSRPWVKTAPVDAEEEIRQSREMASKGYMSDVRGSDDGSMLINMQKLFERQERRRPRNRDIS